MKAGASPISSKVARRVIAKYRSLRSEADRTGETLAVDRTNSPSLPSLLSTRELEVLTLIACGFSYVEIARLTVLSV